MLDGVLTGKLPADLANQVSAAIKTATQRGAALDEACCVAAQVVADHWRRAYGNAALPTLAEIVLKRGLAPLPIDRQRGAGTPSAAGPPAPNAPDNSLPA
jgi:hypothetical protein